MSLNDDFTQYGTNHWKNRPKGCGKRVRKKSTKWYGTYTCPFTDKYVTIKPSFDTKEDAAAHAQTYAEVAWEEFRRKFGCVLSKK